jgi:hypothetical protein
VPRVLNENKNGCLRFANAICMSLFVLSRITQISSATISQIQTGHELWRLLLRVWPRIELLVCHPLSEILASHTQLSKVDYSNGETEYYSEHVFALTLDFRVGNISPKDFFIDSSFFLSFLFIRLFSITVSIYLYYFSLTLSTFIMLLIHHSDYFLEILISFEPLLSILYNLDY